MKPTEQDLNNGTRVRAFSGAHREDTVAVGKMIAYSHEPMICIQQDDGRKVWWTEALVERLEDPRTFVDGTVLTHALGGTRHRLGGKWFSAEGGETHVGDDHYAAHLNDQEWRVAMGGLTPR